MGSFDIYSQLTDDVTPAEAKRLLRAYFLQQAELGERYTADEDREAIASTIPALMGATIVYKHLQHEPSFAPYLKIMEMAGELELPRIHRDGSASWEEMARLIRQLPA